MKPGQRLWTRDELILAVNLYCKLPFGRLHQSNPEIIHLAKLINRTPGSVAYKLVNFASLDPSLTERGIKGAKNVSKLDREIWQEFFEDWDHQIFESEKLLAKIEKTTPEALNQVRENEITYHGLTKEYYVQQRVNQSLFRKIILASYNFTCCVTGLNQPDLLVAGHIRPWATDEKNRLNPRNGLALNGLHDKAFERGLLTITPEYKVKISSKLLSQESQNITNYFGKYHNTNILLPKRFLPDPDFLKHHNNERFQP